jgi:hypothetical protein
MKSTTRRWPQLLPIVATACLLVVAMARPAVAEYCGREMPREVRFARGYTFIATFTGHRGERAAGIPSWDFLVERVFAGGDRPVAGPVRVALEVGRTTTLRGRCYPPRHLRVGERYLISKADLATFSSMSTVIWRLDNKVGAQLVRQYGSRHLHPRLAEPDTVAEVVALMAPEATLPPTDSASRSHGGGPAELMLVLAGSAIAGALAWVRRSRSASR